MSIRCELHAPSIEPHLNQIYTGFLMLFHSGRIAMSQRIRMPAPEASPALHLRGSRKTLMRVVVNDHTRVYFRAQRWLDL